VPKITINNTINLLLETAVSILLISNHDSFRVLSDKIASVYVLFEKYIYTLALEMASPGNRHCANCISAHFRSLSLQAYGCFSISVLELRLSASLVPGVMTSEVEHADTW